MDFLLNAPNERQTQVINITNKSESSQTVQLYAGDWARKEDGGHEYFEGGSKPYSCAKWLEIGSRFLTIGPGETASVPITLEAPSDAESMESMKWAMLFIQGSEIREKIDERAPGIKTNIKEIIRFGVHIYQTPPSVTKLSARAEALNVNEETPGLYDLKVINNGGVMLKTTSFLELTNIATGEEFQGEPIECPIFPMGKRTVNLPLPENLPKGQYSMLAILDYGDPNSLEAIEKIITVE
ncbi:hypothetical protein [Jiulongibacter sediminis]|uniref:Uncharacterized protein n=1 Tax=Jiulongibacter sediminis TaxID=1605367 RepID=A0A0P7C3Y9_9BACT|nr:hypothetical protein [Jiulongibacter sediminis]KPM47879.1 hypothetical protein AFM12_11625 [Jiulongibacter sediminis]TBX24063.1 hypothetical protein TK44_11635 [Jiulongibacter sediminis]